MFEIMKEIWMRHFTAAIRRYLAIGRSKKNTVKNFRSNEEELCMKHGCVTSLSNPKYRHLNRPQMVNLLQRVHRDKYSKTMAKQYELQFEYSRTFPRMEMLSEKLKFVLSQKKKNISTKMLLVSRAALE